MNSNINQVSFPHAPPSSRDINSDHKDSVNQGVDGTKLGPQPIFVNGMIMLEVRYLICQEYDNSVFTAYVFIGNIDIVILITSKTYILKMSAYTQ